MTVYEIDPLSDSRWDALVERHPAASIFHTRGWLQALKRTYGYQPAVLTASDVSGSLTNGLVFCRVNSWMTGHRLVSLPFSDHCEPLTDDAETLRGLISALAEKAQNEGARYAELRPISPLHTFVPSLDSPAANFHLHRLDLRPGAQAIYSRFHKDCIQRKIRRAERENVTVAEGHSPELLDQFYNLAVRTRRRKGLPPQPIKWFQTLRECTGPACTIRIASNNKQPIAGIVTLEHKHSLVYKYGASDERFHNLGGVIYLFWVAIQEGIVHGLAELDMGRSDIDDQGLVTFKDHFGAARYKLSYWHCQGASHKTAHTCIPAFMRNAFSYMPDRCLRTLGTLLYRHVG